ncbi:MocR-like pyridoxine biosynthesis transcription factor PdxR [Methylobacillus pratensis]
MQLPIAIDQLNGQSLQTQIYEAIRNMILEGILEAGQRLPSSRSVSEQLGVSRNTVVLAYSRLAAEDYIASEIKIGIYVNKKIPEVSLLAMTHGTDPQPVHGKKQLDSHHELLEHLPYLWIEKSLRPEFDFFVGRPHPTSFPNIFWRRSVVKHLKYADSAQTEYGDPQGLQALREAVAHHLKATRGINTSPAQIVITSGIQGALNLLSRILFKNNRQPSVAIENPCYQGAALLFKNYGATFHPIEVDESGMIVSQLEDFVGKLAYLTPSHQFPTGYTLTLDRRLQLLDWAYRTSSYIIEDDYDSDFRYDGPPLTALAGLDRRERVIYLGTFSKSIGASIRIGYAVLPQHLIDQARVEKGLLDNGAPWLEQAVIADFLTSGAFLRHLRRIRKSYMAARDTVIEAIQEYFPGSILFGKECGMHMIWQLPDGALTAKELQQVAVQSKVGFYPLLDIATYFGTKNSTWERSIILGYTGLSKDQIQMAFSRIAKTLIA